MNAEYLSECYVLAYEKALNMTGDQNVALNAAVAVLNCIVNQLRLQNENSAANLTKFLEEYRKIMTKSATKKKKKEGEIDETNKN